MCSWTNLLVEAFSCNSISSLNQILKVTSEVIDLVQDEYSWFRHNLASMSFVVIYSLKVFLKARAILAQKLSQDNLR